MQTQRDVSEALEAMRSQHSQLMTYQVLRVLVTSGLQIPMPQFESLRPKILEVIFSNWVCFSATVQAHQGARSLKISVASTIGRQLLVFFFVENIITRIWHPPYALRIRQGGHLLPPCDSSKLSSGLNSGLAGSGFTVSQLVVHVETVLSQMPFEAEELDRIVAGLRDTISKNRASDSDIEKKICSQPSFFVALQDIIAADACEAVASKHAAKLAAVEEASLRQADEQRKVEAAARLREQCRERKKCCKKLNDQYSTVVSQVETFHSNAERQIRALHRNLLGALGALSEGMAGLEGELLAMEGGSDDLQGLAFGSDDLQRLRRRGEKAKSFVAAAQSAVNLLETVDDNDADTSCTMPTSPVLGSV